MHRLEENSIDPSIIQPLEREQRLYERVAEQVLALIKNGTWRAGDRLPTERDLADAFNVSRTVIREAVKYLEAQGWLQVTAGSGIYVQRPDTDLVSRSLETYLNLSGAEKFPKKLIEVRTILELEMAALAAERATQEQREQLQAICAEMRESPANREKQAVLDFRLHALLAEATQNELFSVLLSPLIDQMYDIIKKTWAGYAPRPMELVFAQHEAIAAAVSAGDAIAAREAMREHLAYSTRVMSELAQGE